MNTIRRLLLFCILAMDALSVSAQYDLLSAKKGVVPGSYNFWLYTPEDYYYSQETTPLIVFLHGASLCGNNLNRVLRYGTIDAIKRGLDVPALVIAPQNPGGPWSPKKLNALLEWMDENYPYDRARVYVLGMSLGGYGTMDFIGTYPEKIAAGMALCGGCSLKDMSRMGEAPLWIIHGTGDRAVSVKESKRVVSYMESADIDSRLRYDWLRGASHGYLARYFYTRKTYEWLFSHSLYDTGRGIERTIKISKDDLETAYKKMEKRVAELELE